MLYVNVSRFCLRQVFYQRNYSHKINGEVALDSVVRVCCALNNILEGVVPFT